MSSVNTHTPESNCTCPLMDDGALFMQIMEAETKFSLPLRTISRNNLFSYVAKSHTDWATNRFRFREAFGVYVIWFDRDYCPVHGMNIMEAMYVGKGDIRLRIRSHHETKNIEQQLIAYVSYVVLPNRQAKYVEQLLLDIYNFPLNSQESSGSLRLYALFDDGELDC